MVLKRGGAWSQLSGFLRLEREAERGDQTKREGETHARACSQGKAERKMSQHRHAIEMQIKKQHSPACPFWADFGSLVGCIRSHQCEKPSSDYRAEYILWLYFALKKVQEKPALLGMGGNGKDMREGWDVYEAVSMKKKKQFMQVDF